MGNDGGAIEAITDFFGTKIKLLKILPLGGFLVGEIANRREM